MQIAKQDVKAEDPLKMHYAAKFFPEVVNEELVTPSLRRLLWLQIRDGIVKDEIYCPAELCVLFAAQSVRVVYLRQSHAHAAAQMQALHGDFSARSHGPGFLSPQRELPVRYSAT